MPRKWKMRVPSLENAGELAVPILTQASVGMVILWSPVRNKILIHAANTMPGDEMLIANPHQRRDNRQIIQSP